MTLYYTSLNDVEKSQILNLKIFKWDHLIVIRLLGSKVGGKKSIIIQN
jgi:hypothetical protein